MRVELKDHRDSKLVARDLVDNGRVSQPPSADLPNLHFVIGGARENRWSDLLAAMIKTDPAPMAKVLGLTFDDVLREVAGRVGGGRDRLDILLTSKGRDVAALEVKLLSGLGPRQLDRYKAAFPRADTYRVLHLESLPLSLSGSDPWQSLSWESVLTDYADSSNPWIAITARAWLTQLGSLVPLVKEETSWSDVPDDAPGMELALRSRIAWLSRQMDDWCDLDHDVFPASGGGNWAATMTLPTNREGHRLTAEIQEGMTAYEWKPNDIPYRDRLKGPVVLVGLRQDNVSTSSDFDWPLLHTIFARHVLPEMTAVESFNWQMSSASPRHPTDKANWEAIVHDGAPKWLGKGWGMNVTKSAGVCIFGARIALGRDVTMAEVDSNLRRVKELLVRMAT